KFSKWITDVAVNIENWKYFKSLQLNAKYLDDFQLAQTTFFLNRTNISGVIKGGPIGGLDQRGAYKITARFNKIDLVNRILKIARMKERIIVSNLDGIDFLKKLDRRNEEVFI